MNCLCCGKPLSIAEQNVRWHKRCVRKFFGTEELPEIQIDEKALELLATNNTKKGITVPGVQKKMSFHLISDGKKPRLTLVNYPTGYILKPQVSEYQALPQAEQLVMCMADIAGIATVPHALIESNGELAYITRRIDRMKEEDGRTNLLAMEDFCQLDLRPTQDKCKGSYERCAKIIDRYSSRKGLDMTELFMRLVFSVMVGNSDMHLKNFSLIETACANENYVLSPAYDLLPVNIVMPQDTEEFALTMNGKKTHLGKKDFMIFANECGIAEKTAEKMLAKLISAKSQFLARCEESFMPQDMKVRLAALMEDRIQILQGIA